MNVHHHGHEHEFEPQHGLPERLPSGETILWQGSPQAAALGRHAFHLRKLALYFAVLLVAGLAPLLLAGASLADMLHTVRWLLPLAVLGLASVALLAWMTARTTVYTLTNRRMVMRLGIVLTVTFNVPLRSVASANLREHGDGSGDIALGLSGNTRIAYLQLWPSVRPWRIGRPEPMLRGVADARQVSAMLQQAWALETGLAAAATPAAADVRADGNGVGQAASGAGGMRPSAA